MPRKHHFIAVGISTRAALSLVVIALYFLPLNSIPHVDAASGDEALQSTLVLQMPFVNGETWTVGGAGYFYGEGGHTNAANDYYATDWNRTNDNGASVLPVTFGTVESVQKPPCPGTSYGCYVYVVHPDGYRTLYGHLQSVNVSAGDKVQAWTILGLVGSTGNSSGPHLHLRFQRQAGGSTYYSRCNTGTPLCPNGETPSYPQGHKPSPMMTTAGLSNLQDGSSYTSVNGRLYLSQLRNGYLGDGQISQIYIRNDSSETRSVSVYYFGANGSPTPKVSDICVLTSQSACPIPVNELNRIPSGTYGSAYVDGGEHISVLVVNNGPKVDAFEGIPAAASIGGVGVGTSLRIPAYFNNYYGWNSTLMVQNAGNTSTNVTARLYNSAGTEVAATPPININAKGGSMLRVV